MRKIVLLIALLFPMQSVAQETRTIPPVGSKDLGAVVSLTLVELEQIIKAEVAAALARQAQQEAQAAYDALGKQLTPPAAPPLSGN